MAQPITFVVPGRAQTPESVRGGAVPTGVPASRAQGRIKQSVRIGLQRAGGGEVRVTAVPGEDIVVLHLAGGPALTLHPETARDLLLAQGDTRRSAATRSGMPAAPPAEVRVPAQLQWRGLEAGVAARGAARGFLGDVLLAAIDVVAGRATDAAADFAASRVVQRVDAQVDAGVYRLQREALAPLKGTGGALAQIGAVDAPQLVFVHGTFSNTAGTFGKLWTEHPQRVRALFERYRGEVHALDHPTLGASPIDNALMLARACPPGARLHLVTHSRGGLVAEVLARACGDAQAAATAEHFAGAAYRAQREALAALVDVARTRRLRVERVVRVACPARGTLLASKRLDAYLSVFQWTLQLAGLPVAPALVDFLGEVAQRRADPALIPGLAAQIPDSPLVRWLHALDAPLPGELRVVAGDIEGDSVASWLKTLVADGYYWTDNDLVVQTRSMYGGAPREAGASFVLDQGGTVTHFGYFANERSADAIVGALLHEEAPPAFRPIGPLSWSGASATGVRARRDGAASAALPAVFLLPGILGSNLKVNGKRIWLGAGLINGLKRLDYAPGRPDGVEPDGPVGLIYDDLADFLAATHEVIEFAFDWRLPIEQEARRLAAAVDAALDARRTSGQPVRLVAHSMGGVLARTLQLEKPRTWQRLMAHPDARLLMLGTPNGGSWAPMQVLSGDDTFGNTLTAFGAPFQDRAAREMMARFPGFIQLQAALLDDAQGLARAETWQRLAADDLARVREHNWWHADQLQLTAYEWGAPPQAVLDQAVALRRRLDAQRERDLPSFASKLLLVTGHARYTPDGYELGNEGLVYLNAPEAGDGRVTHTSARLPGVRTWALDCEHGGLPAEKAAFGAYLELLQRGDTAQPILRALPEAPPTRSAAAAREPNQRGGAAPGPHLRVRPSRMRTDATPPADARQVLAAARARPQGAAPAATAALRVTVVNGDLSFVRQPLMLGHYRSMRLMGTEAVVDRLVGGAMSASLKVDLYPDSPGAHQIFVNGRAAPDNPWQLPRPAAVVVVGLGEEGKLQEADLVKTVRQAAIAWAQRCAESAGGAPAQIELAATLIGSGGAGISVGQAARLIAQGMRQANERLADSDAPRIGELLLVELYLDRASDAWRSLQVQATAEPGHYVVTPTVQAGTGALRRLLESGYRGADYDLISALTQEGPHGDASVTYRLDTRRARTEVRAQQTQAPLLRELVAQASNDKNTDAQIGRTLFQLLVPMEMEPYLGGTSEMQLELDAGTAGIPWELLDTDARGGGDARPWAIRSKLVRKLRTSEFRARPSDAHADAHVLVIGEPLCDTALYARLAGARREAQGVAERLGAAQALGAERVLALVAPDDIEHGGADARRIVTALLSRDWRVVHIAGHGEPPTPADPRGVVLSNGTFLGPREIRNMRVVPELVFVNCCHLAARDPQQLPGGLPYDRARFASNVADELIRIGVRCVIAAGWAVEDGPALSFATTFYQALLAGRRFMDAVAEAREAAWAEGGNTWAAYQCYGDPDWTLRREGGDAQRPQRPLADEFAGVASPAALALALETLAVRSEFQRADPERTAAQIRHLESRHGEAWGAIGAVAEAYGVAWAAAGDAARAVPWLERALAANDGSASIKAAERLGNLRGRIAWQRVDAARSAHRRLCRELEAATRPAAALRRRADAAAQALQQAAHDARDALAGAVALLDQLVALQPTMERASLCGSAYKRLAMVEAAAGCTDAETAAIRRMQAHYRRAEAIGRAAGLSDFYYPALNRMAAELALDGARPGWRGFDRDETAAVWQALGTQARDDPDFWSIAGLIELRLYEALAARDLAARRASIESEYADLRLRVAAPARWASVHDQLAFVLPRYAARAAGAERDAARALLRLVEAPWD